MALGFFTCSDNLFICHSVMLFNYVLISSIFVFLFFFPAQCRVVCIYDKVKFLTGVYDSIDINSKKQRA